MFFIIYIYIYICLDIKFRELNRSLQNRWSPSTTLLYAPFQPEFSETRLKLPRGLKYGPEPIHSYLLFQARTQLGIRIMVGIVVSIRMIVTLEFRVISEVTSWLKQMAARTSVVVSFDSYGLWPF